MHFPSVIAIRFLKQLMPVGLLALAWFGTGARAGVSPYNSNVFYVWSCNYSRGVFMTSNGVITLSPEIKPDTPALGQFIANRMHGCF